MKYSLFVILFLSFFLNIISLFHYLCIFLETFSWILNAISINSCVLTTLWPCEEIHFTMNLDVQIGSGFDLTLTTASGSGLILKPVSANPWSFYFTGYLKPLRTREVKQIVLPLIRPTRKDLLIHKYVKNHISFLI